VTAIVDLFQAAFRRGSREREQDESGPVVPALNEAAIVCDLVRRTPRDTIAEVIVVDSGSTDATATVARDAGARVVHEPKRGYGAACLPASSRFRRTVASRALPNSLTEPSHRPREHANPVAQQRGIGRVVNVGLRRSCRPAGAAPA
jgi:glycosyltransferase involved in cell wall biosynthesis